MRLLATLVSLCSILGFAVMGSAIVEQEFRPCEAELRDAERLLRADRAEEAIRGLTSDASACSGANAAERELLLGLAYLIAAGPEQNTEELEAAATALLGMIESGTGDLLRARFHAAEALLRLGRKDEADPLLHRFLEDEPDGSRAEQARLWLADPRCAGRRCLPRVELTATDGTSWRRRDLLGRVLLLEFWATWCSPCVEAQPSLKKLHDRMAGRPFLGIGINVDRDSRRFAEFVRRHEISWPQVSDGESRIAGEVFGVSAYPTWLVVDHEGFVLHSATGWSPEIAEALERAVAGAVRSAESAAAAR